MPAPLIIDSSGIGLSAQVAEYSSYRSLFWFLIVRDTKLRYRQTALGITWAVIQPLLPMAIVTVVFARVLGARTDGPPYWLFALAGFAPWSFFASAINASSVAFVNNRNLLGKIYFPRAILPAAAAGGFVLDWIVSATLVLALVLSRGHAPSLSWLLLPIVMAAGVLVAVAIGLGLASLTAMYRDLRHGLPFLIQIWMYATPVVYPLTIVPRSVQFVIALNPVTGIVEAFRACAFGMAPDWTLLGLSVLSATAISAIAFAVFFRLEADLAERA